MGARSQCAQKSRLLFFTGGTALRGVSQRCAETHIASTHLVTTFDSGGSTAELRRCFAIPAMGDVRNRLLALADPSLPPSLSSFFGKRLPRDAPNAHLYTTLATLADPAHPFWSTTPASAVRLVTGALTSFLAMVPPHFDFRGASVGNCLLTALFLRFGRRFAPTMDLVHALLRVQGRVLPIVETSLHLACELSDGTRFIGQHHCKSIHASIARIFLTVHTPKTTAMAEPPCRPLVDPRAHEALSSCALICYPMGSFYSSVLVNLLVRGVGQAIAARTCPKVFIPNVGFDPELISCSVERQCAKICALVRADAPWVEPRDVLTTVLIDSRAGDYQGRLTSQTATWLADRGIRLLDCSLCRSPSVHDPDLTLAALLLCARA